MFGIDYRQVKETLRKYFKITFGKIKRTKCDGDCWHYDSFGGEEGCGQRHRGWGGWPESVKPGQTCLYPDKKEFGIDLGVVSGVCFCSALEGGIGGVVVEGENDAKFLELLVEGTAKER